MCLVQKGWTLKSNKKTPLVRKRKQNNYSMGEKKKNTNKEKENDVGKQGRVRTDMLDHPFELNMGGAIYNLMGQFLYTKGYMECYSDDGATTIIE